MNRQPIGYQQPLANSKVQSELVLIGKFHIAHADGHVQSRIEGASPPEKDLAGQYVVAYVQVVIRELPPRVADDRDIRKHVLEAGRSCLGAGRIGRQENVLRYVVREAHAIYRIGAEILNAERAKIRAYFEVLGLDLGRLYFAAGHLRLRS